MHYFLCDWNLNYPLSADLINLLKQIMMLEAVNWKTLVGMNLLVLSFLFHLFFFFFHSLFKLLWVFVAMCAFLQLQAAGATLGCGAWASHCSGFSGCRAQALGTRASVVAAPGLQSRGSVNVAHGLSCSSVRGIFSDQGSNPCPLH